MNGILSRVLVVLCLLITAATPGVAAGLLPNGDFEAGSLIGWTASHVRDGIVDVVAAGDCFSAEDTTHITLFGNHSALLRSGPSGSSRSVGILTSDPFPAGDGVVFATLTGIRDGGRVDRPVEFQVRILDGAGEPLAAETFNTSVVRLKEGCPSEPRDGRFYVHYFDTRAFLGQDIRIQFRQNTNSGGGQPFTLIDQVLLFERGEGPLFTSKPVAVAAVSSTRRGVLRLDASHSFDPDGGPLALTYRWRIQGENRIRVGEYPCIGDLPDGTYEATLYVNDGFHALSDSLRFEVTGSRADNNVSDDEDDNPVPRVEIAGCDEETLEVPEGFAFGGDNDGDVDGDGISNATPVVDLDADDSTADGNDFQIGVAAESQGVSIADMDIEIVDEDGDNIVGAVIILQNPQTGDELAVDQGALPAGIEFSINTDSTSVQLQGTSTPADYEAAIRAVTINLGAGNDSRTVTIQVSDGVGDSNVALARIDIEP